MLRSLSSARRRVIPQLPLVAQTAIAAVAAWYLALLLLPSPRPAFASIAAVICLGATHGQRRRRATELVGGVVVGIAVASALLFLIGTGPLQTGLLVALAMTAALLLRGGDTLVGEAAVSAILLASLQQTDAGFSTEPTDTVRAMFWGLGADGTVGANKNTIKIIGEETDLNVQGYFVYDSKKSGAVTTSHLRFSKQPIRSTYLISRANFVACHQFGFMERLDVLKAADPGAVFLLNSPFGPDEV